MTIEDIKLRRKLVLGRGQARVELTGRQRQLVEHDVADLINLADTMSDVAEDIRTLAQTFEAAFHNADALARELTEIADRIEGEIDHVGNK